MELIPGLIITIGAFVAGVLSAKYFSQNASRIKELEVTIEKNKQEFQSYKNDVAEHFSQSASLFGDITEKYRSLYEHMSTGATSLCDRRSVPRELATAHVDLLTIESPELAPKLNEQEQQLDKDNAPVADKIDAAKKNIVDVSRPGLSPLDSESQLIIKQNKIRQNASAEIIDLKSQRDDDLVSKEQAKDYAVKPEGVVNHNSLRQDDVSS